MKLSCPCGVTSCAFVVRYKKKDNSPDMRYNENRLHFLEEGRNKNGELDMRLLNNRKKKGLVPSSDEDSD